MIFLWLNDISSIKQIFFSFTAVLGLFPTHSSELLVCKYVFINNVVSDFNK